MFRIPEETVAGSGNGTECHKDYPAQSKSLFAQELTALDGKMSATDRLNCKQEHYQGGNLEKKD